MQTNPPSGDDPKAKGIYRVVSSIEALNARIARLAISLGVPLRNDSDLNYLMSRLRVLAAPCAPQLIPDRMDDRWKELRGLLVLRYSVDTGVGQVNFIAKRQTLVEAEQHLLLQGFDLGDDGIDPNLLFSES
jgi:hypothetical protein